MDKRPNDIPRDVWNDAPMLWGYEARVGIARCVMLERERCARLVFNSVTQEDSEAVASRCFNLSYKIREGRQP